MTMTLEEAAEKVLRAVPDDNALYLELKHWQPEDREAILSALKSYGDQRFIEGATAMREMAERYSDWVSDDGREFGISMGTLLSLDPNQLKDTDHG